MNRASPVDMRKAMDAVDTFRRVGLLFVAMPVMDEEDHAKLLAESMRPWFRVGAKAHSKAKASARPKKRTGGDK